ncbi:hypothetical protein ACLEEZ_01880 [Lonsdalea quercina]|uniref:hypothetical protein n=1 Tax=Lonsdalea quercina TaxID=71657 RepID=UPI0039751B9C
MAHDLSYPAITPIILIWGIRQDNEFPQFVPEPLMPSDTRNNLPFRERLALFRAVARPGFRQAGFHGAGKADLADAAAPGIAPFSLRFTHKDADIEEKKPRNSPQKQDFHHSAHRPNRPVSHRYGDKTYRRSDDKAVLYEVVRACQAPHTTGSPMAGLIPMFGRGADAGDTRSTTPAGLHRLTGGTHAARAQDISRRTRLSSPAARSPRHAPYQHIVTLLFLEKETL